MRLIEAQDKKWQAMSNFIRVYNSYEEYTKITLQESRTHCPNPSLLITTPNTISSSSMRTKQR